MALLSAILCLTLLSDGFYCAILQYRLVSCRTLDMVDLCRFPLFPTELLNSQKDPKFLFLSSHKSYLKKVMTMFKVGFSVF